MTSAQVLDLKGKKLGDVSLADDVFGIEPNKGLMHSALVRQLGNARRGTASAKTRAEVRGGGRKPWRQKGTGRARAGSIRSPLWEGGGVIFGPKPRDYSVSMNKKMRALAVRSALAAKKDVLVVVSNFDDVKEPRTKQFSPILKTLGLEGKKVLLVMDYECDTCCRVELAARNIAGLTVLHMNNLNVKDILEADAILTTERTVLAINKRFATGPKAEYKPKEKKEFKVKVKAPPAPKVKKEKPKKEKPPKAEADEKPKAEKEGKAKSDDKGKEPKKKAEDSGEPKAEKKPKPKKSEE